MVRLTDSEKQALARTAHVLADTARIETLRHFRRPGLETDNKSPEHFDPVTVADRACEAAIRQQLAELRPEDGILGEEQAATPGTSGLTWVIDPIDGTRGYLAGTPVWGVLIALCDETGPVFGIIDQPYIRERFVGGFGEAFVDGPQGRAALAPSRRGLSDAIVFTTFPEVGTPEEAAAFRRVSQRARLTRYGTDCYAYGLVAAGTVDLVIEAGLQPYDVCAPIAVVQAAGGIVTDWEGRPAHGGGRIIAAANAELHAAALDLLATGA